MVFFTAGKEIILPAQFFKASGLQRLCILAGQFAILDGA